MKTLMPEYEIWQPPQSPLAIEYTKAVVDEVRDQAVAGYRRLARGGVEVGVLATLPEEHPAEQIRSHLADA